MYAFDCTYSFIFMLNIDCTWMHDQVKVFLLRKKIVNIITCAHILISNMAVNVSLL